MFYYIKRMEKKFKILGGDFDDFETKTEFFWVELFKITKRIGGIRYGFFDQVQQIFEKHWKGDPKSPRWTDVEKLSHRSELFEDNLRGNLYVYGISTQGVCKYFQSRENRKKER